MKKHGVLVLIATFLVVVMAGCGSGKEAAKGESNEKVLLNFASAQSSTGLYVYYVALANSINAYSEKNLNNQLKVTVVETDGGVDNVSRLMKDEAQIAVSTIPTDYQAFNGIETFKNNKRDDLRTLFLFQKNAYIPVVRVDSGVNSIEDLHGKPMHIGNVGSGNYTLTSRALEVIGVTPDYYKGGGSDVLDAMRDNEVVGMVRVGNSLNAVESFTQELSLTTDLKPLSWSKAHIKKITDELPYYQFGTIPAGVYPNQDQDVNVQVFYIDVITTKDSISEETAYNLLKGIYENKQMQIDAFPLIKDSEYEQLTMDGAYAPLHPGAVKFYKERGVTIPDHLIPPEAK